MTDILTRAAEIAERFHHGYIRATHPLTSCWMVEAKATMASMAQEIERLRKEAADCPNLVLHNDGTSRCMLAAYQPENHDHE